MSLKKFAKIIGWTLAGIVILFVAVIGTGLALMTPERIARLVNTELSKVLDADIRSNNIYLDFLSSFPILKITVNSLSIVSHSLNNIPDSLSHKIPDDTAMLMSSGKITGSVNIRKLLNKEIELGDLSVDSLCLNLINVNDSVANWNIIQNHLRLSGNTSALSFNSLNITHPQAIRYRDLTRGIDARLTLDSLALIPSDSLRRFHLGLAGSTKILGYKTPLQINCPVRFGGNLDIGLNPITLRTDRFLINIEDIGILLKLDGNLPAKKVDFCADISDPVTNLQVSGYVSGLLTDPTIAAHIRGNMTLERLSHLFPKFHYHNLKGLISAEAAVKFRVSDLKKRRADSIPVEGIINFKNLHAENLGARNSLSVQVIYLEFDTEDKSGTPVFTLDAKVQDLTFRQGSTTINFDRFNTSLRAETRDKEDHIPTFKTPSVWMTDDNIARFARSTPRTLRVDIPEKLRRIMANRKMSLKICGNRCMLMTPAFPVRNYLTDIDIDAGSDSLLIRNLGVRSQSSSINFTGSVSNIRQFLLNPGPAPLRIKLHADIDTLQCNQLAAVYERGVDLTKGPGTIQKRLADNSMHPSDSIAFVIPRNIRADISATIKRCIYTNLLTYDWLGDIHIADGVLKVDSLAVKTGFVEAGASIIFDTSNLENIYLSAQMNAERLELTEFFDNFPKILKMMPVMKNLSGTFNAKANIQTRLFPTMYLMMPATAGEINILGRELVLQQNRFIRKITRMMMIPDAGPLHIANMNIRAGIFDNLIMLYPFGISFDRYDVTVGGLNNFAGDIYYHIGVDRWPLRIPFGVNIKGTVKKPEIRLGGDKWKDSYATGIVSDIDTDIELNVMQLTRKYGLETIHKAAVY